MKTVNAIILLTSVVLSIVTLPLRAEDSEVGKDLEKDFKELAQKDPDYETAKQWFKLRDREMPDDLRQYVFKAAAAALLCSGKSEVYGKLVAPSIKDRNDFESSVKTLCAKCNGVGTIGRKCGTCLGSGVCSMSNCKGAGVIVVQQIDGTIERQCGFCHGTGKCGKCAGTGVRGNIQCGKCEGCGSSFDKEKAWAVYKRFAQKASAYFSPGESAFGAGGDEENEDGEDNASDDCFGSNRMFDPPKPQVPVAGKALTSKDLMTIQIKKMLASNRCDQDDRFLKYALNFKTYRRWKSEDTTTVVKNRLFDELWDNGYVSDIWKSYYRSYFVKVPDGLYFMVEDVKTHDFPNGKGVIKCTLKVLFYDEEYGKGDLRWRESRIQTREFLNHVNEECDSNNMSRISYYAANLQVPIGCREVLEWPKGKIIKSDGWITEKLVENSVLKYKDGREKNNHDVFDGDHVFFRSMDERMALETFPILPE